MEIRVMACCGVKELHGLSAHGRVGPKDLGMAAMKDFLNSVFTANGGKSARSITKTRFIDVIFTQAGKSGVFARVDGCEIYVPYGDVFRDFILSHNLGTVIHNDFKVNPNSSNAIRTYIWTVNWKALSEWALKEKLTVEEGVVPVI